MSNSDRDRNQNISESVSVTESTSERENIEKRISPIRDFKAVDSEFSVHSMLQNSEKVNDSEDYIGTNLELKNSTNSEATSEEKNSFTSNKTINIDDLNNIESTRVNFGKSTCKIKFLSKIK